MRGIRTFVVIGTDCICSCKSNYDHGNYDLTIGLVVMTEMNIAESYDKQH